ncbi:hypothetical protein B5G06_00530 [Flavonifractor sp. An52]|uniref:hypothetical protein n=1 Tax=Flavonifractor sp. An52 TaxID=1965642 RepID=UPI000B380042|nr:hypothetical protein [Flavonifractor sp. An52]OUN86493.1 hypothetical protein B5G06_00530 [Flavonifractor sp. An52]
MSKKNPQIASENMKMNFSKGWGIILYQALMFFFLIGFSIDGLNIVAPAFSEATGVDYRNAQAKRRSRLPRRHLRVHQPRGGACRHP